MQVDSFVLGGKEWWRAKYSECDYSDNIGEIAACLYLSAYMLAYSKMLMQCSFQFLVKIGAVPLMTDTDSIVFLATPEMWAQYRAKFVPFTKTFGGMDFEGLGIRLIVIGPKKYAFIKPNGDYEWRANGIRARNNPHVDIVALFERVLKGSVEQLNNFSINHMVNFELRHSLAEEHKKLRFICRKGAVENDAIRWWRDEAEFADFVHRVHPEGYKPGQLKKDRNTC